AARRGTRRARPQRRATGRTEAAGSCLRCAFWTWQSYSFTGDGMRHETACRGMSSGLLTVDRLAVSGCQLCACRRWKAMSSGRKTRRKTSRHSLPVRDIRPYTGLRQSHRTKGNIVRKRVVLLAAALVVTAVAVPTTAPAASAFGQLPVMGYNTWYQFGAG